MKIAGFEPDHDIDALIERLQAPATTAPSPAAAQALVRWCAKDGPRCWSRLAQVEDDALARIIEAGMQLGAPALPWLESGFALAAERVQQAMIAGLARKVLSLTKPTPDAFALRGSCLLKTWGVPLEQRTAIILHVEDELLNRTYFKQCLYLSQYPYIVFEASTGAQGLQLAQEISPDLVAVDINLTGMSGYEVIRQLRSHAGNSDMIVVAFTAYMSPEDRERICAIGCDGYIEKPINISLLPQQLQSFFEREKWYDEG